MFLARGSLSLPYSFGVCVAGGVNAWEVVFVCGVRGGPHSHLRHGLSLGV